MISHNHLSFLSDKAFIESTGDIIRLKPLDYYEKRLDQSRRELSTYCLSHLNDIEWNDVEPHTFNLVLDGWVIYKEHVNKHSDDYKVGSDEWSLNWLKERFNVIDLCSRSIYKSDDN